jgi:L-seryl-tRNA(Ser) seleniumtransferase
MVRMTGATPVEIGTVKRAGRYQLEGAITDQTAAALFVVSHHTSHHGLMDLRTYVEAAHARGVPVIVDAASEANLTQLLQAGADLLVASGHKVLQAPTSGVIAGSKRLVDACLMNQLHGIGRAMKAGKEAIVGVVAALQRWERGELTIEIKQAVRRADQISSSLREVPGLSVEVHEAPTATAGILVQVKVTLLEAGLTAAQICHALRSNSPRVHVRDHEAADLGYFWIDPFQPTDEEAEAIVAKIRDLLFLPDQEKKLIREASKATQNAADQLQTSLRAWDVF